MRFTRSLSRSFSYRSDDVDGLLTREWMTTYELLPLSIHLLEYPYSKKVDTFSLGSEISKAFNKLIMSKE